MNNKNCKEHHNKKENRWISIFIISLMFLLMLFVFKTKNSPSITESINEEYLEKKGNSDNFSSEDKVEPFKVF